jgi:hypothetical protein
VASALIVEACASKVTAHTPIVKARTSRAEAHTPIVEARTSRVAAHTPIVEACTSRAEAHTAKIEAGKISFREVGNGILFGCNETLQGASDTKTESTEKELSNTTSMIDSLADEYISVVILIKELYFCFQNLSRKK